METVGTSEAVQYHHEDSGARLFIRSWNKYFSSAYQGPDIDLDADILQRKSRLSPPMDRAYNWEWSEEERGQIVTKGTSMQKLRNHIYLCSNS